MNKIRPVISEILDCKGVRPKRVTDLFGRACIFCGRSTFGTVGIYWMVHCSIEVRTIKKHQRNF